MQESLLHLLSNPVFLSFSKVALFQHRFSQGQPACAHSSGIQISSKAMLPAHLVTSKKP